MTSRHLTIGIIASLLIAGSVWYALGWAVTYPAVLCSWLAGVNIATFGYYGFDKRQAMRQGRRVPETALLTLAAIGGSLGAYAGMKVFHHKTVKGGFRTLFWLIVVFQAVLIAWAVRWAFWGQ